MTFRFQHLEIWQLSKILLKDFFEISEVLENRKLFRWAEQLRSAGLSICNNIAEGSGSYSDKEFSQFLNISRRSAFECANVIFILEDNGLIDLKTQEEMIGRLDEICRKIHNFRKTLDN